MKTIVHVDMDAFFAAVEVMDNPALQGKPIIIGGNKSSKRGVVATCSYEARKFGVHSAMPLQKAISLCPKGIFLPGRMERYKEVSTNIHSIFPRFSPVVEPLSIDEAFLDMTGCEHFYNNLEEMGQQLKNKIKEDTGITASIGIAHNKFLAKLASDYKKPDGLMIISQKNVDTFLTNLPISKLWGVGAKSEKKLASYNIYKVQDLRQKDEHWLKSKLGDFGVHLYKLAYGIDERNVETKQEVKSISQETTFAEDYDNNELLRSQLALLVEKVGWRLRKQQLWAKTVNIKVRYSNFQTITRAYSVPDPIHDDDTLFHIGWQLFNKVKKSPVRLLGFGVSNLTEQCQLSLLDNLSSSNTKLTKVIDSVNNKFNKKVITKGRTLS